jgi:N-acetylglucosaminyldiphosphoundecaprenol N-acetyl-beta-D-mannosaminyltransferase
MIPEKSQMPAERFAVLGVNISVLNLEKAVAIIDGFIREGKKRYVCVAPVSTVVACQDDEFYRTIINSADLVTPDGMPLVWLGRLRGFRELRRTYGPDLMRDVCEQGQKKGCRHYFYGGTPEVCQLLESRLKERFPAMNVAGWHAPPFKENNEMENPEVIQKINQARPDILWVGLGSPKQDLWMSRHRDQMDVPVMIGIGAAFDFLSGVKKQAPVWMQRSGLEWLFRLFCEPGRLWKRYLVGNTRFVCLLLRQELRNR